MINLHNFRLQFITNANTKHSHIDNAMFALDGGCRWIQLRMKDTDYDTLRANALQLQTLCKQYDATFIINDNVKLVQEINADGVHLGKLDMPINEARNILTDKIIGGTANTIDKIMELQNLGADYIGLGPYKFTKTKQGLDEILGIKLFKYIERTAKVKIKKDQYDITLPITAIGGITADDIPILMNYGLSSVAISGAIINSNNPTEETVKIISLINNYLDAR